MLSILASIADEAVPIRAEIQSLSPTSLVTLFELNMENVGGSPVYFHAGTNELQSPVTWQGIQYLPLPIEAEGFDINSKGALPRPKIRVANINGIFSAAVRESDDLVGCKIVRRRTFKRYLDAVNFPGGMNSTADPNQHLVDDVWFIERKVAENRYVIEWELASAFDLQGVMLPYRQIIQNSCPWKYRGPECGWTGSYYDTNDQPTGDSSKDVCGKRLNSCKARFGASAVLPYGGFPGAMRGF